MFVYTHTHGILFSHEIEWNPLICDEIDGTGDYYVKKNKPSPKRQVWHHITHVESIKVYLIEIKGRMVFTRDQEK